MSRSEKDRLISLANYDRLGKDPLGPMLNSKGGTAPTS